MAHKKNQILLIVAKITALGKLTSHTVLDSRRQLWKNMFRRAFRIYKWERKKVNLAASKVI
jgi:hypothetical protein